MEAEDGRRQEPGAFDACHNKLTSAKVHARAWPTERLGPTAGGQMTQGPDQPGEEPQDDQDDSEAPGEGTHVVGPYGMSDLPFISFGCSIPIMCNAVGATSARRPPSVSLLPFMRSSTTMSSTG